MSLPLGCCVPCSTPELVSVPGFNGTDGTNGYTAINGNAFISPAMGATLDYIVDDARWIAAGMYVFIEGIGTFLVVSVLSDTSVRLTYVDFWGNTHPVEAIADGALVAPSGAPPTGGLVFYGAGTPEGAVTATRPAIFYDALGNVWVKTGAGSNNTGWSQIIAAP